MKKKKNRCSIHWLNEMNILILRKNGEKVHVKSHIDVNIGYHGFPYRNTIACVGVLLHVMPLNGTQVHQYTTPFTLGVTYTHWHRYIANTHFSVYHVRFP